MLPLSKVPSNQPIFGFDPKKTGFGSGAIHSDAERPYYGYSYAIVAHNKDGSSFLLTVFPGPNMQPHEVSSNQLVHGVQYTKEQLKYLGIRWVKLIH